MGGGVRQVGSTTVTSALLMRCLEQELQRRSQSASSVYPAIHAAQVMRQSKSSEFCCLNFAIAPLIELFARFDLNSFGRRLNNTSVPTFALLLKEPCHPCPSEMQIR